MDKKSETKTENIFRNFYGVKQFIEKSAIPNGYGFRSKRGTGYSGYPDFFRDSEEYAVIVETKANDIKAAEAEVQFYMRENKIKKDILGIALSGQTESEICVSYWVKLLNGKEIFRLPLTDELLSLADIQKMVRKFKYKDKISAENLITTLRKLNKRFQNKDTLSVADRSMFFSGLMIALKDNNFRKTYKLIEAPSKDEVKSKGSVIIESEKLNKSILDAITSQISGKINNLSKAYNWADRFAFIKYIDYSLIEYKEIIEIIEKDVFAPFQSEEKQDILGRAYRIFLSRTGTSVEDRNIIITPDHIKGLMVKLARIDKDDIILDTCAGTGGFLMEAMETMISQAEGNPKKIKNIQDKQLIGFEIEPTLFALACSNMFLHGDGRTNLIFRSSLLNDGGDKIINSSDKDLLKSIKAKKPTKVIINPPYENNKSIKFAKQALDYLMPNGRLVIIMPTPTLKQNQNGLTEKILGKARLDFVIKMPNGLFSEQKRTVNTSIFGFTKSGKHQPGDEAVFYNLEDDGLVSIQHKGRIDKYKRWSEIEENILRTVLGSYEEDNICEKRKIYRNGILNCYGFSKRMQSGNIIKVSDLFNCDEKGSISSEDSDGGTISDSYDFITASEERKKHSTADHDKEAIIFAAGASGSLGRTHYVNGKFSASNLCLILTPKKKSGYKINLEFYNSYFAAIRKQLVSDLADGTSKLVIRSQDLKDYYIEYIDYSKQERFVSSYIRPLEKLRNEYKEKIEKTESEIRLLLSG